LIPDTLKLKFYLRDGDFDLGLGPNDINPPYNLFYFLDKASGELIPGNEIPADYSNLVIYKDRKTIDTLPALNCSRWMLKYSSDLPPKVIDTLYFQANPNARNLFLGIYTEDNTQVWTYFDINAQNSFPNCSPLFDATFPQTSGSSWRSAPFRYQAISSKEGILTYAISSIRLKSMFHNRTIKGKVYIQDRALHRSNVIETTEIQIP
jgi:hypothetical protein